MLKIYLPVSRSTVVSEIVSSAQQREFVIFDEQLSLYLVLEGGFHVDELEIRSLVIWINEAEMLHLQDCNDSFEVVKSGSGRLVLKLNSQICSDKLFRSTVVMNNGLDNIIKFAVTYLVKKEGTTKKLSKTHPPEKVPNFEIDFDNEVLNSFEPIYQWNNNTTDLTKEEPIELSSEPTDVNLETVTIKYPIFSLINMRLKNINLTNKYCIISSLDFQCSKSILQLIKHYNLKNVTLNFKKIEYKIVDKRKSKLSIDPISAINTNEIILHPHDSFALIYKLPTTNQIQYRVEIILQYIVNFNNDSEIPVWTQWETDINLKDNNTKLNTTNTNKKMQIYNKSINSISRVSTNTTTNNNNNNSNNNNKFTNSIGSLIQKSNIKLKILTNNLMVQRGTKFNVRLQITNLGTSLINMVIYYNNEMNINHAPKHFNLNKKVSWFLQYEKILNGIILLTNDYKLPIINCNDTVFVDLKFVSIKAGYYPLALKLLDLQTNEQYELNTMVNVS